MIYLKNKKIQQKKKRANEWCVVWCMMFWDNSWTLHWYFKTNPNESLFDVSG